MSRLLPITYCEDCLYDGGDGVCYNPKLYEKLPDPKAALYNLIQVYSELRKRHAELMNLVSFYFEAREAFHYSDRTIDNQTFDDNFWNRVCNAWSEANNCYRQAESALRNYDLKTSD